MSVDIQIRECRLASGVSARVVYLMPHRFHVLPLFAEAAPPDEMHLALILAKARLGMPVAAVPPAAVRMAPCGRNGVQRIAARAAQQGAVACAPLRLLRTVAAGLRPGDVLINGNYFLFLAPEVRGPFDAYGDPIGLTLVDGRVETPPQLKRACLLMTKTGPEIRRIGFSDISISAAGQHFAPHPLGQPKRTGIGMAFALFHGSRNGCTPPGDRLWEVAFVGRHSVAISQGGGLSIPRAGCVLRCASEDDAKKLAAEPVTYGLPDVHQGVQAGPMIVAERQVLTAPRDIFAEEFMSIEAPRPDSVTPSPHAWKADWDTTRSARLAAGVTAEGQLFFCAVEGTSSFLSDGPAQGATLLDLATLMCDHGAITALHLDGGGSTQVFCEGGGALVLPRDVHHGEADSPAQFDRPLPLGLVLS